MLVTVNEYAGSAFSFYTSSYMNSGVSATDACGYRLVINISSEVLIASSNGTKEKPYELTLE